MHPVAVTEQHGALLRPEQVAEILGIGRTKLYVMIRKGELPVLRVGRLVRIPEREFETWMSERITVPKVA